MKKYSNSIITLNKAAANRILKEQDIFLRQLSLDKEKDFSSRLFPSAETSNTIEQLVICRYKLESTSGLYAVYG
jgi:hypothetical protein